MTPQEALVKIEEIRDLGKIKPATSYMIAAIAWLLKDRIDQLVKECSK